jgi:hypothetical protein
MPTPLPKQAQALHLRIGRVLVDAPAGADRHAIARTLERDLAGVIGARLAQPHGDAPLPGAEGPGTLTACIADAVAKRLRPAEDPA